MRSLLALCAAAAAARKSRAPRRTGRPAPRQGTMRMSIWAWSGGWPATRAARPSPSSSAARAAARRPTAPRLASARPGPGTRTTAGARPRRLRRRRLRRRHQQPRRRPPRRRRRSRRRTSGRCSTSTRRGGLGLRRPRNVFNLDVPSSTVVARRDRRHAQSDWRIVTGAASSISRLASSLRDDTTVVATAARAPTASATRSSSSSKSSSPSADRDCAHYSEASCALFDRFVRARAGVATLRTHWQCCPVFWATRPPFATRAATIRCGWLLRARPRRFRPLVNK